MSFQNVCIACLATNVEMFNMNKSSINIYSSLTGITIAKESDCVCFICWGILTKIERFALDCLRAHNTLTSSKQSMDYISQQHKPNLGISSTIILCDISDIDNDAKGYPNDPDPDLDENSQIEKVYLSDDNHIGDDDDYGGNVPTEKVNFTNDAHIDDDDDDYGANVQLCDLKIEIHGHNFIVSGLREKEDDNKSINMDHDYAGLATENLNESNEHTEIESNLDTYASNSPYQETMQESHREIKHMTSSDKNIKPTKSAIEIDKSMMEIVLMSSEDAEKEVKLRKKSDNYKNSRYKCDLCFRGFILVKTYSNHMQRHNAECGDYECYYCHVRAQSPEAMKKHISIHHIYKYSCKLCNYICFEKYQAINHIRHHEGTNYECEYCNKIFQHHNTLSEHIRKAHSSETNEVLCVFCGAVLRTKTGLSCHITLLHPQFQESAPRLGPTCVQCDVQFCTVGAYKRHLVLSKKHTDRHSCAVCSSTFSSAAALQIHERRHEEGYKGGHAGGHKWARRGCKSFPSVCDECPVTLTTRAEYTPHMLSCHPHSKAARAARRPSQYVCEHCGKAFKKRCDLTYHLPTHTGARPYACLQCGARFQHPTLLSSHKRRHHSDRAKAQCEVCAKMLSYDNLQRHMRSVHQGIRPHKCEICDKAFHDRCTLKLHIKCTHDKVPWPKPNRKTATKKNEEESEMSSRSTSEADDTDSEPSAVAREQLDLFYE
ncbi:hypothetical protein JYU34_017701 [Plutella xylostella]|uniref:Uncharacterized protein n=1 Tax=Plutella xylostella TaxID=51655 RepID=A0ABQ7Q1W2_PLUXY|nr:hypothetical protein JYU34_017701 [Plutella xylostella]